MKLNSENYIWVKRLTFRSRGLALVGLCLALWFSNGFRKPSGIDAIITESKGRIFVLMKSIHEVDVARDNDVRIFVPQGLDLLFGEALVDWNCHLDSERTAKQSRLFKITVERNNHYGFIRNRKS